MDDKSTDGSLAIAKNMLENCSRQYIIHENPENLGISASRNAGVEVCSGEYLTFLDADDMLAPDAVEVMLRAMMEKNSDVLVANCTVYKESFPGMFSSADENDDQIEEIDLAQVVHPWAILYKSEAMHIRFDTKLKYAEDFDFNVRMSKFYPCVPCIHRKLYGYRRGHSQFSITAQARRSGKVIDNLIVFAKKLQGLVDACDVRGGYRNTVSYKPYSNLPALPEQCFGEIYAAEKHRGYDLAEHVKSGDVDLKGLYSLKISYKQISRSTLTFPEKMWEYSLRTFPFLDRYGVVKLILKIKGMGKSK